MRAIDARETLIIYNKKMQAAIRRIRPEWLSYHTFRKYEFVRKTQLEK